MERAEGLGIIVLCLLRFTLHLSRLTVCETDQETEKITSISTGAPRGNSAAPTATRA